jgi:hypothetical protein
MVESGQTSVEDAIGLISAGDQSGIPPVPPPAQRWLRVRVTNLETGKGIVSVRIPLAWMKLGLAFGSRFAPELDELDIDEVMTAVEGCTADHIVEIEDFDDRQRVEVFIE